MPATSEGFDPTGLPPNPVVKKSDLDLMQFDPQTAELFALKLNRLLDLPETTNLKDSFAELTLKLQTRNIDVRKAWEYFHSRFQGLQCGLQGTWEQACNEIVTLIKELRAENEKLHTQLAPLLPTDRSRAIELVPSLAQRISRLEEAVFAEK